MSSAPALPSWGKSSLMGSAVEGAVVVPPKGLRRKNSSEPTTATTGPAVSFPFRGGQAPPKNVWIEQRRMISVFLQEAVVSNTKPGLVFRCLMMGVRRRAIVIQRAWRGHVWRRNALLERHLTVWAKLQGQISEADVTARWKRNSDFVKSALSIGSRVPRSQTVSGFVDALQAAMQQRNLDKNIMMEVLMQGYMEARVFYVKTLRRAKRHKAWLDSVPSFLRVFNPPDPNASSFSMAAPDPFGAADGGFDFALDECQARYAALKHHYDDVKLQQYKAELARSTQQKAALANFTAFGGDVSDSPATSNPLTPQHLALTEQATLSASNELSFTFHMEDDGAAVATAVHAQDNGVELDDHNASAAFFAAASRRAMRHVTFANSLVATMQHQGRRPKLIDYEELQDVGPRREERMMWTNSLGDYLATRLARERYHSQQLRRVSMMLEEQNEHRSRRGSVAKATTASRRASRRASEFLRQQRASLDLTNAQHHQPQEGTAESPTTATTHTFVPKRRNSRSPQPSTHVTPQQHALSVLLDHEADSNQEANTANNNNNNTNNLLGAPMTEIVVSSPSVAEFEAASPPPPPLASVAVPPLSASTPTPSSPTVVLTKADLRRLSAERRKEVLRRHALAHRPLSADVTLLRPDGSTMSDMVAAQIRRPKKHVFSLTRPRSPPAQASLGTTLRSNASVQLPLPTSAAGSPPPAGSLSTTKTRGMSHMVPTHRIRRQGGGGSRSPTASSLLPDDGGTQLPTGLCLIVAPEPAHATRSQHSTSPSSKPTLHASRVASPALDEPNPPWKRLVDATRRPHSAATQRLPPWKAHQLATQGVNLRKEAAGYAVPRKVATALGATSGPLPSSLLQLADDAKDLEVLCRRVAKGNTSLESALRREWQRYFAGRSEGMMTPPASTNGA